MIKQLIAANKESANKNEPTDSWKPCKKSKVALAHIDKPKAATKKHIAEPITKAPLLIRKLL